MQKPPLESNVADLAPAEPVVTLYDYTHLVTYWRLLDANKEGADWREVSRIVLRIDPAREPQRARQVYDSHLARAKWMSAEGYRHLLRGDIAGLH
ncbi:hypothetical protein GGD62_008021 [Bradyrhizobium sp. ERR14]|nr:hypothetical protein [Bradyrhizobium sp. ERR14]